MREFKSSIFKWVRPPVHQQALRSHLGSLIVLFAIAGLILVSTGCSAIPANLLGQSAPTRAAPPTPVSPVSIVITTTPAPTSTSEASPEPSASAQASLAPIPTAVVTPTVPPATIIVQAVPTLLPTFTPVPAAGSMQVKIFLIAIGDNGVSGPKIGCGDSAVGVVRVIPATRAPLTAALNELLSIHDKDYGQSGLYNSLYQSNLQIQSVTLINGVATIRLTGTLTLGGECDDPRVDAQITNTALQFPTVHSVVAFLNGKPLKDVLSGK
jgi:hypothetical protein